MSIAEIVVGQPIDKTFSYSIPPSLERAVCPGVMVKVPFGRKKLTGYCVGTSAVSPRENLKEIQAVEDPLPAFDTRLFKLAKWISSKESIPLS